MRMSIGLWGVAGAAVVCAGIVARAADPAVNTGSDEKAALHGPAVHVAAPARQTLVEREFDGRLKRLDIDPAIAALGLLGLPDEQRNAADKVVNERYTMLDALVREHGVEIFTLSQDLKTARESGDRAGARRALAGLAKLARPVLVRGRLSDEIGAALPVERRDEFAAIVEEYSAAAVADRMSRTDEFGENPTRPQAETAEALANMGQEFRGAYERTIKASGGEFDRLLKELDVTPEQEGQIRAKVTDLYLHSKGAPGRLRVAGAFLDSYRVLNAEQRMKLAHIISERSAEERAAQSRTDKQGVKGAGAATGGGPMRAY